MKKNVSRRDFLRFSAYGVASVVVSNGLVACGGGSSGGGRENNIGMRFSHGVASGDPLSDRVIIWARALPDDILANPSLTVNFEVALDESFDVLTNNGEATVNEAGDFILKVDVANLEPATTYYYRFISNGVTSVTGKTKTLPAEDATVTAVNLAVMSCTNYPNGFFNVYNDANSIDDIDAVVHLGDYIYEYRMGEYATENAVALGRTLADDNDVELIELIDYRRRYALYRSDNDLQTLHQNVPFIVVPDDHEVANDTFISGAENHDPVTEGDFTTRKLNALQAYFEWLPIRPAAVDDEETFYRSFKWGNLVNLMMLDTRLIGRTEQLPPLTDPSYYNLDGSFNAAAFAGAVGDPTRTMLGAEQLAWLTNEMSSSSATWDVLGQQVLMGRMNIPFEVLVGLGGDVSDILTELAVIKIRILQGDPTVTPEEAARVNTAAPYNLDAWDGYQFEREVILNTAATLNKNLVVLAGDTHNAWTSNLRINGTQNVGVEFATASVTSPGLEDFLNLDVTAAMGLEQGLGLLIDDLQYANLFDRGLMVVRFTANECETEWRFVDTIESTNYTLQGARAKRFKTNVGENTLIEL